MRYLTVDGMLSGTGVRDSVAGGYIDLQELNLPTELVARIERWVRQYAEAHYYGFENGIENDSLDQEGIELVKLLKKSLPKAKIEYFSSSRCVKMTVV